MPAALADHGYVEKVLSVNGHPHAARARLPVAIPGSSVVISRLPDGVPVLFSVVVAVPPRAVPRLVGADQSGAKSGWHTREGRDRNCQHIKNFKWQESLAYQQNR